MSFLKVTALGVIAIYIAVAAVMYVYQRSLQYFPAGKGYSPEDVGIAGAAVEKLLTPDGETIILWHSPARVGQPTILYFHGNGGEMSDRAHRFKFYQARGLGVVFVSYRGYGGSSGRPTEQGLMADARRSYEWLLGKGVEPRRIFLVGESLGTGIAVQLAATHEVGAVALEAPYTSTVDVAAGVYWWLPVRLLMKDQYRSIDHIARVSAPLLILYGDRDGLIPAGLSRRLFEAANGPKEIFEFRGMGHELIFEEETWEREVEFFGKVGGK
jgi:uncharacterized protein